MTHSKTKILCAEALLALLVSCSSDKTTDSSTTSGGSGGDMATAGSSGSGGDSSTGAGAGGESAGASGNGGTAEGGGGSGGDDAGVAGSGGEPEDLAPPCAVTQGTNDGSLTLRRTDISARKVGNTAGQVIRIDHDPLTGNIVFMSQGGGFWKVDPTTSTISTIDMHYPGGNDHRGMAFGSDGTLYILSHGPGPDTSVKISKGVPDGAGGRTWSTVATSDGYPVGGSDFDHKFGGLAVSPDNQWLFIGSGSRSDHGEVEGALREVPLTSAIFRVPTNGNNILLQNDDTALAPYLYADGVRNPFEISFGPNGDLFATDNGPDMDLPEELNWIREGKHYGFPWRLSDQDNPVLNPLYTSAGDMRLHVGYQAYDRGTYAYDSTFPLPPLLLEMIDPIPNRGPDADKFRNGPTGDVEDSSDHNQPLAGLTAHRSPLGLSFDNAGALCGDYYKSGFLLSFGAFLDVLQDHGEDLLLVQLDKVAGDYEMHLTQLATGFTGPVDSVLVGNKLYVVEYADAGGSLYELTFPQPAP